MESRLSFMRFAGVSQLFLSCICIGVGTVRQIYSDEGPVLYDKLNPAMWCSIYGVFSGMMVVSTSYFQTYTKVFWSMFGSMVSSFFFCVLFGLELFATVHSFSSAVAGNGQLWYLMHFGTLTVSLCLLVVCVYSTVVFGRVYNTPEKDDLELDSDTGLSLVQVSILCIVLSIPAVVIAYAAPYDVTYLARVGAGIWCSVMCAISGAVCYFTLKDKSNGDMTAVFAFGIISSVFAVGQLGVEIGAAVMCFMYQDQYPEMATAYQLHMLVAVSSTYQLVLSIYIAVMSGKMRSGGDMHQEKLIPKGKQFVQVYNPKKNSYYPRV